MDNEEPQISFSQTKLLMTEIAYKDSDKHKVYHLLKKMMLREDDPSAKQAEFYAHIWK